MMMMHRDHHRRPALSLLDDFDCEPPDGDVQCCCSWPLLTAGTVLIPVPIADAMRWWRSSSGGGDGSAAWCRGRRPDHVDQDRVLARAYRLALRNGLHAFHLSTPDRCAALSARARAFSATDGAHRTENDAPVLGSSGPTQQHAATGGGRGCPPTPRLTPHRVLALAPVPVLYDVAVLVDEASLLAPGDSAWAAGALEAVHDLLSAGRCMAHVWRTRRGGGPATTSSNKPTLVARPAALISGDAAPSLGEQLGQRALELAVTPASCGRLARPVLLIVLAGASAARDLACGPAGGPLLEALEALGRLVPGQLAAGLAVQLAAAPLSPGAAPAASDCWDEAVGTCRERFGGRVDLLPPPAGASPLLDYYYVSRLLSGAVVAAAHSIGGHPPVRPG